MRRSFGALSIALAAATLAVRGQGQSPPSPPAPRYRPIVIESAQSLAALRKQLGVEAFLIVLKINRVDLEHVRQGATLLVPEQAIDLLSASPFPREIPAEACPSEKLLAVSRRVQAFAAYDKCTLVRWGPTSTGRKESPTPAGLYHTNWRSRLRRSTENAAWLLPWLVNIENSRGISFHQFDLPGYPASHACVRLLADDARWVHDWMDGWILGENHRTIVAYGTPVIVFDDYDYDGEPPWKRLAVDPLAASVTVTDLQNALAPHAALIASRAQQRVDAITAVK